VERTVLSGSIRRGLTFTFRAAFGALWLVAGCGELLGIEDPPAPSECVKAADCGPGRTCVEWKCVEVCRGAACAGSGGEAGHSVSAGRGGDSAGEGGRAARGGTTNAGGDAGEGVSGRGGESGEGGGGAEGGSAGAAGHGGNPLGGAGGEGGISVEGECTPGDSRCLVCEDDHYVAGTPCESACTEESGCVTPRSCNGLVTRCGPNESCCKSLPVEGGSFLRSCDLKCQECTPMPRDYPANISHFALDAYEVTVARFRTFVVQYMGAPPAEHSGKNPRNASDTGWPADWNELLPDTREELERSISDDLSTELDACGPFGTWTSAPGLNEAKPINCVSFYLAYAFCIWDGGRLPTEAEWNYAAAGGDEQRVYPWSSPAANAQIGAEHAVFGQPEDYPLGPSDVGSMPAGNGRFGHSDLAGNLAEWVFDDYSICYPTPDECSDCGYSTLGGGRLLRGGYFASEASSVLVESRLAVDEAYPFAGFRCARDL
jgi:sulfatase modifying factor 1